MNTHVSIVCEVNIDFFHRPNKISKKKGRLDETAYFFMTRGLNLGLLHCRN